MKILITGGAGYIGWTLVRQLLKDNPALEEILIYDNLSRKNYSAFFGEALPKGRVRFVQGDILDERKLQQTLRGFSVLIHLAAKVTTPFADSQSHAFDQVNHWGTAQVANAVENSGITQLIYLSSASVYGSSNEVMDEQYDPHPDTFYGISKLDGEVQVSRLIDKLKVHILRAGNVYGHNRALRLDSVVNRFMFDAHYNGRISIEGSGNQKRSFIHIDKLCYVISALVRSSLEAGTYNLSEHNLTINELASAVREIYPEMEMMLMNQNMKGRNVSIKSPCLLQEKFPWPEKALRTELEEFQSRFSF